MWSNSCPDPWRLFAREETGWNWAQVRENNYRSGFFANFGIVSWWASIAPLGRSRPMVSWTHGYCCMGGWLSLCSSSCCINLVQPGVGNHTIIIHTSILEGQTLNYALHGAAFKTELWLVQMQCLYVNGCWMLRIYCICAVGPPLTEGRFLGAF